MPYENAGGLGSTKLRRDGKYTRTTVMRSSWAPDSALMAADLKAQSIVYEQNIGQKLLTGSRYRSPSGDGPSERGAKRAPHPL
jgi:hypothetical protein